jgi:hypothetical protein
LFERLAQKRSLQQKQEKKNLDTQDELLARILYDAAHINRHEGQLRRKMHDIRTLVAKSIKADSGIFEHLF